MLTVRQLLESVRPGYWMMSVTPGRILPHLYFTETREFRRFLSVGEALRVCRLPLGYSLAPHTFLKCVVVALEPLRRQGLRSSFDIDDWLIRGASTEEAHGAHTVTVLQHVSRLGLS